MRTTINKENARKIGLPIPEGSPSMILYEIEPADISRPVAKQAPRLDDEELRRVRETLGLDDDQEKTADGVARFLSEYHRQADDAREGMRRVSALIDENAALIARADEHEKQLAELRALLDSEQGKRKTAEQELEDALAKLTEPPAKPEKPADPAPAPAPEKPPEFTESRRGRRAGGQG